MRLNKFQSKLFSLLTFLVVFLSAFLLAFVFSSLSHPIISSNAAGEDIDVTVNIQPYLTMTATPDPVNINLTGAAGGAFDSASTSVQVATNNPTGYTLTLADQDTDTAMKHTNPAVTASIVSITADSVATAFGLNTWGYSLDNATYKPIPASTSSATLKTTATTASADATTITFGANIDDTLPTGTYSDVITLSATTNYVPSPTFNGITTMQQMTTAICDAETTPANTATTITTEHSSDTSLVPTATLTDMRDNKTYQVSKLADGKCWMTQNLALGSSTQNITLTDADSNLTTGATFTIPASAVQTSGATSWSSPVDAVHVYDNGSTWIEPTSAGQDSTVNTTGTPDTPSKYIGNYYNWYTATAGTGTESMSSGNASSSICPKGWKLPTGGADSDFTSLTSALIGVTDYVSDSAKSFTMQSSPNYFAFFGNYYSGYGGVNGQGTIGNWRCSTARGVSGAYNLGLGTARVDPQNHGYKADSGFSVRCIAE